MSKQEDHVLKFSLVSRAEFLIKIHASTRYHPRYIDSLLDENDTDNNQALISISTAFPTSHVSSFMHRVEA